MQWTMRERTFKRQLILQANIRAGQRILDLGCGTATLTIMLKQVHPEAEVIGLDGDEKALSIARKKIAEADLNIELRKGMSFEMDFPDQSFDIVISSLLFHHLGSENKLKTFREISRILKPTGELHIADWGKPQNFLMRGAFLSYNCWTVLKPRVTMLRGSCSSTWSGQGLRRSRKRSVLPHCLAVYVFTEVLFQRRLRNDISIFLWIFKSVFFNRAIPGAGKQRI